MLQGLLALAKLQKLGEILKAEASPVPFDIELDPVEVLEPLFGRKTAEKFVERERQESRRTLRRQIEHKFGALPTWADEALTSKSPNEVEELMLRVLDVSTLEDLLQPSRPGNGSMAAV